MNCVIPGNNVKVFGRAIHCLAKIGEDLYMEPTDTGLALRAVNSARSAFSCFMFSPSFFLRYDDGSASATQPSQTDGDTTKWRVTMKSCQAVFKSLYNLEKNVDRCNITLDTHDCRLIFQLHCRHGIVKTFNLVYQETETLQAVFSKDLCPNRITAPAKLLAESVGSFQVSQEEVTLTVNPTQLSFKNYVDEEPDPSRVVHSELHLSPEEFTHYSIGVDTEVTFCLKELRAIFSFSDAAGVPISISFETMGKPIVFSLDSDQTVEATFVLATLADVSSSQSTTAASSQQSRHPMTHPTPVSSARPRQKGRGTSQSSAASSHKSSHRRGERDSRKLPNGHSDRNGEEEFPDNLMADLLSRSERTRDQTSHSEDAFQSLRPDPTRPSTSVIDPLNEDVSASPIIPFDSALSHRFQTSVANQRQNSEDRLHPSRLEKDLDGEEEEKNEEEGRGDASPNRTFLSNFADENSVESFSEVRGDAAGIGADGDHGNASDEGDDAFDFIPGTPPTKKFKSMFFGASQSQQSQSSTQRGTAPPSRPQPHPRGTAVTVLAEDSDDDDD